MKKYKLLKTLTNNLDWCIFKNPIIGIKKTTIFEQMGDTDTYIADWRGLLPKLKYQNIKAIVATTILEIQKHPDYFQSIND